jgi:biotin carboxyl carrier protein
MQGYRISVGGNQFDVQVLSDPNLPEVQVRVDGELLTVHISPLQGAELPGPGGQSMVPADAPPRVTSPAPVPQPPGVRDHQLMAPLPGTVVQVIVEPGQQVSAGDELLVIEAMKMNNQIRSPRHGTVGELLVRVGQQVNHGEPLLTWKD